MRGTTENSISFYLTVPENLQYLSEKTAEECWRILSKQTRLEKLARAFSKEAHFDFLYDGLENPKKPFYLHYFDKLEEFGDSIAGLINVQNNLYFMSSQWFPHVLYLTPQCGAYEQHQVLLEAFSRINKSYIEV